MLATNKPVLHLLIRFSSVLLLILILPLLIQGQEPEHKHNHKHKHSKEKLESIAYMRFHSDHPTESVYGKWESVLPKPGGGSVDRSLGMQTVHVIMLPSGKLLMTSGSSWRNIEPMEYYPEYPDPVAGKGLFDRRFDPFNNINISNYYQLVNNTAIYDPIENTFFRIHSPYPIPDTKKEDHFIPNDFFCAAHLHLPNGNPFFIGGTQYYYPYRTGTDISYIFDWRKELKIDWQYVDWRQKPQTKDDPWIFSGLMKRGRWYPSLVPLLDGRFAIFSGFVGFDKGYPDMYQFEINHFVEFFDPNVFDARNPQISWRSIDVKDMENSPFATKLEWPQRIDNICYDFRHLIKLGFDTSKEDFVPPCDCPPRCMKDHKYDAFKLYPHNYLIDKNRIYLTREGEWVSLRTANTEYMRRTRFTYFMEFNDDANNPKVSFSHGPLRPDTITSYGTSFIDPSNDNIVILGGQEASHGTLLPLGSDNPNHFAGGQGSRKIEQFQLNTKEGEGFWIEEDNFLGDHPQDDRTNHFAIILPTRQILVISGANYDFYGGVKYPILLTPKLKRDGSFDRYEKRRLAEAVEPRLYHNSALLLPDGKVWVSGGNSARATVHLGQTAPDYANRTGQPLPDSDLVDLDVYFLTDGQMAKQPKGADITPTENWTAEIFSPPYLFIDKEMHGEVGLNVERRASITRLKTKPERGITFSSRIGGKMFYLLKSDKRYEVELGGVLPNPPYSEEESLVLLKLPSVTHAGQWGQHYVKLPIDKVKSNSSSLFFTMPNAIEENIPPGFYMLFYVDKKGKPSISQIIRFDDKAKAP